MKAKKPMRQSPFLLLAALAFGTNAQEFRETAVPDSQIQAVVRDVAEWHDMQHPDCKFVKALGSTLVENNADGTIEHWSIEACSGKTFVYRVFVMPGQGGGVADSVSNVDGSPADIAEPESAEQLAAECEEDRKELEQMGPVDKIPDEKTARAAELSAELAACQASGAAR